MAAPSDSKHQKYVLCMDIDRTARVHLNLSTLIKVNDSTLPLHSDSSRMEADGRLRVQLARTNRLKFSFVPSAISLYNASFEHM